MMRKGLEEFRGASSILLFNLGNGYEVIHFITIYAPVHIYALCYFSALCCMIQQKKIKTEKELLGVFKHTFSVESITIISWGL